MYKHAALSPAIQALEQTPTPEAAQQAFEQQFGQQAYATFQAQFPDLVENIITFKTLDSDVDRGTAFGTFILDLGGEHGYVPTTFVDSEIAPLDILYVKSRDAFVPFTPEWIDETLRGADKALGEAAKLPDTVPTDVDIRNLVVPPTTGRYSYASAPLQRVPAGLAQALDPLAANAPEITPEVLAALRRVGPPPAAAAPMAAPARRTLDPELLAQLQSHGMGPKTAAIKAAAEASAPLGRSITKRANEQFDPAMWENFIEQYARMNGVTPGVALDQGQTSLDELSGLYKSHCKTWQPQAQPGMQQPAQGAPQGAPQGMPQQPYPKTAGIAQSAGRVIDEVGSRALESAALGSIVGGLTGVYDNDYGDIGNRMVRGGVGGALGGVGGHMLGGHLDLKHPTLTKDQGADIGQLLGVIGGGLSARASNGLAGGGGVSADFGYRYASAERGVIDLIKHAKAEAPQRDLRLLGYLDTAPNTVKTAFAQVLRAHPHLLKFAAETYGTEPLLASLRPRAELAKTAGRTTENLPGLRVAKSNKETKAFGSRSPLAFRGVQMRGYYYEDPKPAKNLAVLKQEYHDLHDMRESGVYLLWKTDGSRQAVLSIPNPVCVLDEDRLFYPKNDSGVVRSKRYAPGTKSFHPEPEARVLSIEHPGPDVERSHELKRLLFTGEGKYLPVLQMHGEQVTESALEGTPVGKVLFTDKSAPPAAGLGVFVNKVGSHYTCTQPIKLSKVSKSSTGVITATATDPDGMCTKVIRIDPRAPTARVMRPRGEDFTLVPATWRWVPLKGEYEGNDILTTASAIVDFGLNALGSMGAHEANVISAGSEMSSVDGKPEMPKAAALKELADRHEISGADAEAMLKIAELEGRCRALVIPRMTKTASSPLEAAFMDILGGLTNQMGQIQSQISVLQPVIQRAQELAQDPNAMQATDPAMQAQGMPQGAPQSAPQGMPQGMPQGAPQGAPQGMPQDPNAMAQGAPQGVPGGMPQDPNAMAQGAPGGMPQDPNAMAQGAPQDPNAMAQGAPGGMPQDPAAQQPQLPMMNTEGPSAAEIAQQVNPTYLSQAAALQDQGVFDVSALSELERAAGSIGRPDPAPMNSHSKDLAETVDDLGRTLLSLRLRQTDLQEQLSDDTYHELEDQVRNTFQGLGKLMLELKQHSAALSHVQAANAT